MTILEVRLPTATLQATVVIAKVRMGGWVGGGGGGLLVIQPHRWLVVPTSTRQNRTKIGHIGRLFFTNGIVLQCNVWEKKESQEIKQ